MQKRYVLVDGSTQHEFMKCRNDVQIFSGGYANGKSTALVIKLLTILKDYPGCSALLGRSTLAKLEKTTKEIFFKWCPPEAIAKMPTKDRPTCELKNGSRVTFGYIRQEGKGKGEDTTSNVLSATYDVIAIDQIEDPEITYKDYMDMFGRLRGNTAYRGNDQTMPRVGPQWLLLACNPTRNWVYRKIVRPLHLYLHSGVVSEDLLIDESGKVLISLFNGSTEENAHNLEGNFLKRLRAKYKGAMKKRFMEGLWEAYEGLIYPDFDLLKHVIPHSEIERYYKTVNEFYVPEIVEGFDYGLVSPSCHLLAFCDPYNNVVICDGHYEPTRTIHGATKLIQQARIRWDVDVHRHVDGADPQIFKRTQQGQQVVGQTIAGMFQEEGIYMNRGNNNIINGVTKVNDYLDVDPARRNVFTGNWGSPRLFVSDKLNWFIDEISDYYWKKSPTGEFEDVPVDKNDHAMDALKYMLSKRPNIVGLKPRNLNPAPSYLKDWGEIDTNAQKPLARHAQ